MNAASVLAEGTTGLELAGATEEAASAEPEALEFWAEGGGWTRRPQRVKPGHSNLVSLAASSSLLHMVRHTHPVG